MNKKLPIFKLVIDDTIENSGVNFVALVDSPAIKTNWFAFDSKVQYFAQAERQLVTMPLMIADLPIYRRDAEHGEYYVVFDKPTIEKIQQKFMMNGYQGNVNEMHDAKKKVEGVYLVNSFCSDKQMGINAPDMFSDLPDGTWFGNYKFTDKAYWDATVKSGEFQGVSVEGVFDLVDEKAQLEKQILQTIKQILK